MPSWLRWLQCTAITASLILLVPCMVHWGRCEQQPRYDCRQAHLGVVPNAPLHSTNAGRRSTVSGPRSTPMQLQPGGRKWAGRQSQKICGLCPWSQAALALVPSPLRPETLAHCTAPLPARCAAHNAKHVTPSAPRLSRSVDEPPTLQLLGLRGLPSTSQPLLKP